MIKLPIDSSIPEILTTFNTVQNLILKASPGSGKTTRLPPALVKESNRKVVVLVPKRIAAVSAADRIAEENGWTLGNEVGYHVRFEPVFNSSTRLLFMTEGVFIKKAQDQKFWDDIDVLIFDEFHERSSLADIALGLAVEKQILEEKLKLIVMSATLNSKALEVFLPDNITIEISAPPHPLKVKYQSRSQRLVCDQDFFNSLTTVAAEAWNENSKDLLVFLPGFGEIKKAEQALLKKFNGLSIDILHGSVKLSEQKEILKQKPYRRVVLATDIAESSLTLPSVDAVIDCGLKKVATTDFKMGFNQLSTQRISQFSATQRAGRAARVGPGSCYKLWHQSDELSMPEQIKPEVLKSDLLQEILTLKSCGVDDVLGFTWLDKPEARLIVQAETKLKSWDLLNARGQITSLGSHIQKLPLDIPNALLFYKLAEAGVQKEASHFLSALETIDLSKVFGEKTSLKEDDLERLFQWSLSPQGQKIKSQLESFKLGFASRPLDFRKVLLDTCFHYFPHKVAKRKTDTEGVSSLGRGLNLLEGLTARYSDYYVVFSGYNVSDSKTEIYFAVGLNKNEFLELSATQVETQSAFQVDLEKKQIYKVNTKKVGDFIVSESARIPLQWAEEKTLWPQILKDNIETLLNSHPDYLPYAEKLQFLVKKKNELALTDEDFHFLQNLNEQLTDALEGAVSTMTEFFNYPLKDVIDLQLPDEIRKLVHQLPDHLTLPQGKKVPVHYSVENAPMISVKIQEVFGWPASPVLLGRLPVTLELLAPNYRPTQITQNLKLFWEKSYFEIRKELKARYPKHPWPDNPVEFKFEKKK